jgi:hypothetical protein|tara:strand:+ start:76 stop:354 length:279 start_codon:yes stop_codon:yes gene_type:complete
MKIEIMAPKNMEAPKAGRYVRCSAIGSFKGIKLDEGNKVIKNHRIAKEIILFWMLCLSPRPNETAKVIRHIIIRREIKTGNSNNEVEGVIMG